MSEVVPISLIYFGSRQLTLNMQTATWVNLPVQVLYPCGLII